MNSLYIPNHKRRNNRGFTLVELLLYVSISGVILLVISVFLSTLLESRVKNQTMNFSAILAINYSKQNKNVLSLVPRTLTHLFRQLRAILARRDPTGAGR